jgi:hypothetical protein
MEYPSNAGVEQLGNGADFDTSRLSVRAMLAPVTLIGEGNVIVTEEAGGLLL